MVSAFEHIEDTYESLFINNKIEFSFIGFENNEQKELFGQEMIAAIKLLKSKTKDKYVIKEDWRYILEE
ncbi:MAG: hypothetical protein J1E62_04545 [Lachnospiraceae bacterium]|nr:hypothetical protein [Lachnospiraceae bacterium]